MMASCSLLSTDFTGPNRPGVVSPAENFLYVGDWDEKHRSVNRYPVNADAPILAMARCF